jgi:hypothetical protein
MLDNELLKGLQPAYHQIWNCRFPFIVTNAIKLASEKIVQIYKSKKIIRKNQHWSHTNSDISRVWRISPRIDFFPPRKNNFWHFIQCLGLI